MRILKVFLLASGLFFLISAQSKFFELDSFKDFQEGKFQSSFLSSGGKIYSGPGLKKYELDAESVWCILELSPEHLLIGTGNQARLFEFQAGKINQVYQDPNRIAITSLLYTSEGKIYFSVIPQAIVYKWENNQAKEVTQPGIDYIWTLHQAGLRKILAGGGAPAQIYLLQPGKKARKILELEAEQVMEVISADSGRFYAVTSAPAMIVRFSLSGEYSIIYTFTQEEIKAVRRLQDGSLLIAVNQGMARPLPSAPPQPPQEFQPEEPPQDNEGKPVSAPPLQMPTGRAGVYIFNPKKGIERILTLPRSTILSLAGEERTGFFIGTDHQGQVYKIYPGTREYLVFNLDAGKVSALAPFSGKVRWLGTGEPALLVKTKSTPAHCGYQSEVLDAGFISRWGKLDWQGSGRVEFKTRSGNTPQPDQSWSDWEKLGLDGKIKNPPARYLQFQAGWLGREEGEIDRVELSYRPLNQAHYITALEVKSQTSPVSQKPSSNRKSNLTASLRYTIRWQVENPDQDPLEYQLFYRRAGDRLWSRLARPEEIKGTSYQWKVGELADGWYQVRLVARDSLTNPEEQVYKAEKISSSFLIDSTKPELKFSFSGGIIRGKAQDQTSRIALLEFSLDDKDFSPLASRDKILDEKKEEFELNLSHLKPGWHKIIIRACDQKDNCISQAQEFRIK